MAKPNRAAMIKDEAKKSILLLPAVILLVCFFIVPIILTVYYSFTNMALTGANAQNFQFVGIDNYVKIFKDQNTDRNQEYTGIPDRKPCRTEYPWFHHCLFDEGKSKSLP